MRIVKKKGKEEEKYGETRKESANKNNEKKEEWYEGEDERIKKQECENRETILVSEEEIEDEKYRQRLKIKEWEKIRLSINNQFLLFSFMSVYHFYSNSIFLVIYIYI